MRSDGIPKLEMLKHHVEILAHLFATPKPEDDDWWALVHSRVHWLEEELHE